jgi:outer membrane protein assembly factor BamB
LYIEGMQSMNCRDVYTGRILWQHKFEDLGTHGIYYDDTYTDTPLELDYNQVHLPGANGRGSNYVVTSDAVYVAVGGECIVLDAVTGETIRTIALPKLKGGDEPQWGFIGVYDDVLLAGNDFSKFRTRYKVDFGETDKKLKGNKKGFGSDSYDVSASAGLMAFDRHTGKQLWNASALHGFIHNGIVAGGGKVYCLDKLPLQVEQALGRRGKVQPETYRIVAFDIKTGHIAWENSDRVFGTWLSYSAKHDLLLQAGATASDRLKSEVGAGMAVHFGASGKIKWRDDKRAYTGPCILHHDTILTSSNSYKISAGAFSLLDGKPILTTNPLTGEEQPWQVCRAYGCNNIIASENLLTFRSGAAGYYDLKTKSGTGNLGGFKSGCTSNLIVANGVLNAPDYTRTCVCAYQNQTSLGLVHMPGLDIWTVNQESQTLAAGERFSRIGINFGAPGDRMDETGTLWIDYPLVGGKSAELNLEFEGDPAWYRTSSSKFSGEGPAWIGASGVMNATRITIPMSIAFPKYDGAIHQVLHQNDDAEEDSIGNVNLESSDLELIGVDKPQVVGIRFRDIDIPRGTKIRSAFMQFTVDEAGTSQTDLIIQSIDAIDPPTFKDKTNDVSSRPRSKTKVVWKPAAWKKEGDTLEAQRTPDLGKLISEHIDREDWVAGKAIGFIITGKGERCAKASVFDADGPLLIIDADVERLERSHPMLQSKPHTVRLHFADPQPHTPGQRSFAVSLQGKRVIEELDIARTTGQSGKTLVREFKGIDIGSELTIDLEPISGQPIISGVEIVEEN